MAGFLNEIAPPLTFPTDERNAGRGAVVLANWRVNGLLIARLKLREAMKIGFAGLKLKICCQYSIVILYVDKHPGQNSIFSPALSVNLT